MKDLKTPLLIIRGQCDNQKWGFSKEYLDLFTHSKLEIGKDAGHDLIGNRGEEYYELVKEFLVE